MLAKDGSITFITSLSAVLLLLLDAVFAVPFITLYALLSVAMSDNVSVTRIKSGAEMTAARWPVRLLSLLCLTLAPISFAVTDPPVMLAGLVLALVAWVKASNSDTLQRSRDHRLVEGDAMG